MSYLLIFQGVFNYAHPSINYIATDILPNLLYQVNKKMLSHKFIDSVPK